MAGSGWLPVMFNKPVAVNADERTEVEANVNGVSVDDSAEMHAAV